MLGSRSTLIRAAAVNGKSLVYKVKAAAIPPSLEWVPSYYTGLREPAHIEPSEFKKDGDVSLNHSQVTLEQVGGLELAKLELQDIIEFLKNTEKYKDFGASLPRGILLTGEPGVGKTMLAKAIAAASDIPFLYICGSDFVEMYVGVGAARVRQLYVQARELRPCIVFIDEIDAIGKKRNISTQAINEERESTLNSLLVELDGFNDNDGIITIACTNRVELLDSALTRSGRFDRHIQLNKPDENARRQIFESYLQRNKTVQLESLQNLSAFAAELTPGMTGAQIKCVCNEAAMLSARLNSLHMSKQTLLEAIERVTGGLRIDGSATLRATQGRIAVHEAGHSVIRWILGHRDDIIRISIVPRVGGSLGYTQTRDNDKLLVEPTEIEDEICTLLGGRAAEKEFFGTVSSGSMDDYIRATELANLYVRNFAFDNQLGPRVFPLDSYGSEYGKKIDDSIDSILRTQLLRAEKLVKDNKGAITALTESLLLTKSLDCAQINDIMTSSHRPLAKQILRDVELFSKTK